MKKAVMVMIATGLFTTPVQAAEWSEMQPGTFVGARVRLTLGGNAPARPQAALTLAPTMSRTSSNGMVRTTIGEGVALNFSPQSKPTLSLAGVRADTALRLRPQVEVNGDRKLGVSKGGKIAIGVGAALLAGAAVGYVMLSNRCTECDQ